MDKTLQYKFNKMKKGLFISMAVFIAYGSIGQVAISNLPTYTGNPSGGYVPIVVGGATKKIDAGRLGTLIDTTKIPYLAKNNNFTGSVDSFQTIVTSGTAKVGGGLTVGNTYIPYFTADTTLNAAGGGAVPISNAVKAYVANHQGSGGGTNILPLNNNFTGSVDTFTSIVVANNYGFDNGGYSYSAGAKIAGRWVYKISTDGSFTTDNLSTVVPSQSAVKTYVDNTSQTLANLSNNVTTDSASTTKYPTVNAVKAYVANHSGGGGASIDTTKIPYLAKNNNFTGSVDSFQSIVVNNNYGIQNNGYGVVQGLVFGGRTLSIIGVDGAFASNNNNSTLPTQGAVKTYVDAHQGSGGSVFPYKVYSAFITQSGTANPTVTVLTNSLGGTIDITRLSTGMYRGILTGATFTTNKTSCLQDMGVFMGKLNSDVPFTLECDFGSTVIFTLYTNVTSSNILTDGLLENLFFEIRVYP